MPNDVDAKNIEKWARNASAADLATPADEGITRALGYGVAFSTPGGSNPSREFFANQQFRELTGALLEIFHQGCAGMGQRGSLRPSRRRNGQ